LPQFLAGLPAMTHAVTPFEHKKKTAKDCLAVLLSEQKVLQEQQTPE
jgi:hypothetical protein